MDSVNKDIFYENNKDKILSSTKNTKLSDRKKLLSKKGFSENLAVWARINSECITLCFSNSDELEIMLLSKDVLTLNSQTDIEILRRQSLQLISSTKLKKRKEILSIRKFPTIIAPWVRINKETISLNFNTPEDFDKFLAIRDLILEACDEILRPKIITLQPNSNV